MRDSTLKMLAAMAEGWQAQTADMVDLAVATVMVSQGLMTLTITTEGMTDTSERYNIARRLSTTDDGGAMWTFYVRPKADPNQRELEVTSP